MDLLNCNISCVKENFVTNLECGPNVGSVSFLRFFFYRHDKLLHSFIFSHVVRWLELQRQNLIDGQMAEDKLESYMEQVVHQVISQIRFPMMTPRQLAELLLSPLTTKYKEFFIEKMAIGMSFHSSKFFLSIVYIK